MHRLGYTRYVAQGGDQGAGVIDAMGREAPDGLLADHFNFLDAAPRELLMAALNLGLASSEEDREQFSKFVGTLMRGYIAEMGEHPQTIGYPLLDSPVGLAAWMLDHDADSYDKIPTPFSTGSLPGTSPGITPRNRGEEPPMAVGMAVSPCRRPPQLPLLSSTLRATNRLHVLALLTLKLSMRPMMKAMGSL